jgi:hypothetical protein
MTKCGTCQPQQQPKPAVARHQFRDEQRREDRNEDRLQRNDQRHTTGRQAIGKGEVGHAEVDRLHEQTRDCQMHPGNQPGRQALAA